MVTILAIGFKIKTATPNSQVRVSMLMKMIQSKIKRMSGKSLTSLSSNNKYKRSNASRPPSEPTQTQNSFS